MRELRVRTLHDLIPAAQEFPPDFAIAYVQFLRSLRERLHPIGIRDVRLVETTSGLKWCVDLGDRLGADFYYGHCGEFFESQLFLALLEPGATVIDVGANFGYYTVSAAAKVGPAGVIHAFEPDPFAFKLLRSSIHANRLTNVRCHHVCLGAEDGETLFHVMAESAFSGISPTGRARLRKKLTMRCRRLDSILADEGRAVTAIKIDVEGHEGDVLRGSGETIRQCPGIVVMLEVNDKNLNQERRGALHAALEELYADGFRGWVIDARE